ILKDKQPGHVLIFMPGKREIGQTIEHVEKLDQTQILPLPAHSEMDQDDQHRILEPSDKRKVIVATNIAETSITVDQVAYVIDSGLIKHMTYDHKHGIGELKAV